jgi:hypothetical protein
VMVAKNRRKAAWRLRRSGAKCGYERKWSCTPPGREAEQTAQILSDTSSLPNPLLYSQNRCQAWYISGRH